MMPALNFQKRFAPLVESGKKSQTIRALRKDGRDPNPGDTLYLYTGMRTKACRKLGEAVVERVETFELRQVLAGAVMRVDDRVTPYTAYDDIARADGFDDFAAMVAWFRETHGLPFSGLLIQWSGLQPPEAD